MAKRDAVTGDDIDYAIRDAEAAGTPAAVIERIMAAVDDPALRGPGFSVGEALVGVSQLQLRFGLTEEAEATMRAAVDADSRDELIDARGWLAALLVDIGKPEEAAREFATLKELGRAGPDEHLVYGEALETAGAFPAAVKVFAAGELAAERAGEPGIAAMLRRSADRARNDGVPSGPRYTVPALAAGGRPEREDLLGDLPDELLDDDPGPEVAAALFWPRADHERVIGSWPELGEEVGGDWDTHRAITERVLTQAGEAGAVPLLLVSTYESFAPHAGAHPTAATLDGYLRKCAGEVDIAGWPPERNAPCWCGSGQKYKRCCRPRGFAAG